MADIRAWALGASIVAVICGGRVIATGDPGLVLCHGTLSSSWGSTAASPR